jgi:ELWxxDGT repeat protein
VYFVAEGLGDRELWTSDGTMVGTKQVRDINPSGPSDPEDLKVTAGRLFFTADDGVHGRELWTSDGTEAGTFLVSDLLPGPLSSGAMLLGASGSNLYIRGSNGLTGNEIWRIDALAVPTESLETLPTEDVVLSSVWPNPFTSRARLEIRVPATSRIRTEVFDILGRHVATLSEGWVSGQSGQTVEIDGSNWAPGVYFVRVSTAGTSVTRSFIKSR